MKRAGISRVAVEVIILVIGVALALLIFSPIGSYIFGALGRTSAVGGQTTVTVLSAEIDESNSTITLYVKNVGPSDLDLDPDDDSNYNEEWQVFVDNKEAPISSTDISDDTMSVNEVVQLTCSAPSGLSLSETSSYNIVVYGPGGTQTEYLYRGG
ncbi:MAG: hypothetical protein DRO00_04955 [Thermoproteota archaeon]|nr:MAG: hypothetical protein DRO00_04955 [Candidatus Korarchaeota archaeon]